MSFVSKSDIKKLRASSVLKNDKSFGVQNIFDGNEETCWSSDEGKPQWISIEFKEERNITAFSFQFQGGFVGKTCHAEFKNNEQLTDIPFYPDDSNSVQNFSLPKSVICKDVKFIFEESTDFFGRIIVYLIKIYCNESMCGS